ncbi:alpha/beta fold hydrolase [Cognatilysobacter lacus]|uniref:Alpha/beta hydrolase n=1 Tax=Cognatilysobacter lacus TaxID=1643323 RepID=A0A5D8Z8C4_9GAMM|nr:alpha/beta hydrolase [Lysobacter lacus]TZF90796.1 alpha/beta hydrolase [Lysobacter lacus]
MNAFAPARRRTLSLLAVACLAAAGHASATEHFQDLTIDVVGKGRPVLMIPGLNSGADTWRDTCAALQKDHVQCHIVNLPGFAGVAASATGQAAFLDAMRDRLLAYAKARHLRHPVVIGHSLGGDLALEMAIAAPDAVGPLVIVDSLPFFPAAGNPAATVESTRPMADGMRTQMRASDEATYLKGAEASVANMAHDPARVETLKQWGHSSDRNTTSEAMYELMTTDLRPQLAGIKSPTLVLGSWAAYKPYGSTKESTANIFRSQYAGLDGVRIEMSEAGYHFLMWDDPTWLQTNIRDFLASHPQAK